MDDSFLLAGLGNPGSEYEDTRHNIGFKALDQVAAMLGVRFSLRKWQGIYCQTRWQGVRLYLVKPETYMNRSGECIKRFKEYFKIPVNRIIVIHDDLDLPVGRVKITAGGGAGGHNGIRSIINHLGSRDFIRIKIGIGRPPKKNNRPVPPVEKYVLSPFPEEERRVVAQSLELVPEAVQLIVEKGLAAAMTSINGKAKRGKKKVDTP